MPNKSGVSVTLVAVLLVLMAVASAFSIGAAHAAPTTITAYKASIPVNVKGTYSASSWTDTQTVVDPNSGISFAVKQNGTGWLFLMIYKGGTMFCSDTSCYGGIELGSLSNTEVMGGASTPTIMILASPSFKGDVDEFVSSGEQTPATVESMGYATQSVCGLATASGNYVVQCYRPFSLKNASPYDFPTLGVGSTIEIGFAVGEYSQPGEHAASDMTTYVLAFSSATTTSTASSSSSSSASSTTTTSTSKSTTTTSSTPSTSTTTTSTTTTTPTTSTSTSTTQSTTKSTTTTTSTTSSSPSTSTTSTIVTTSSSTTPSVRITVTTDSASYVGTQSGLFSGTVIGGTAGSQLQISITNSLGQVVYTTTATLQANGTFTGTFKTGGGSLWVAGIYAVTATYGTTTPINASKTFYYSLTASATTTVVSTITQVNTATTTASVTGPTSTVTALGTNTVTQTATMTTTSMSTSNSVPTWAYGVMIVLLAVGLAAGYIVSGTRRTGVKA